MQTSRKTAIKSAKTLYLQHSLLQHAGLQIGR